MEKFKQLNLSEGLLRAIETAGFVEPSEIQEKTIPLVLAGRDVLGSSATGSGKTLAFGAGIIDNVQRGKGIQALVLTPTRELAEQVAEALRKFSRHAGLTVKEIYGGVGMGGQVRDLRYSDIVVGTPGRLLDHLRSRTLHLNKVRYLVLDEADRMLDMGFIRDVDSIIKHCPSERQTLLFSATISSEIKQMSSRYMHDPVSIAVGNQVDPTQLYQTYYDVDKEQKFSLLLHLLKLKHDGVSMIFCNTRRNVDRLSRALNQERIHAMAIHGGLSQNRRSSTLAAFHDRDTMVLVCTDVAARGIDVKGVTHVYNFDIPATVEDYTHRIGRTARAGKNGIAVSFVCSGDHGEFRQISKSGNFNIEKLNVPKLEAIIPINFGSNMDRKINRQNKGRRPGHYSGNKLRHDRKWNPTRKFGGNNRRGDEEEDSGRDGRRGGSHGGFGRFRGSSRSRFSRR